MTESFFVDDVFKSSLAKKALKIQENIPTPKRYDIPKLKNLYKNKQIDFNNENSLKEFLINSSTDFLRELLKIANSKYKYNGLWVLYKPKIHHYDKMTMAEALCDFLKGQFDNVIQNTKNKDIIEDKETKQNNSDKNNEKNNYEENIKKEIHNDCNKEKINEEIKEKIKEVKKEIKEEVKEIKEVINEEVNEKIQDIEKEKKKVDLNY